MLLTVDKLFSFYEGKRVLVCGASGMTGHNLLDLMEQFGAKVVGTCHENQEYTADQHGFFHLVDFTNTEKTKEFFDQHEKFDFVFICCAKTYNAQVCLENPEAMILPNIQMVSNILSNCLRTGVGKALYVSSATVYQPAAHPLKEFELDLNQNPHPIYMGIGWVKRYIEKLCEFYSTKGLPCFVVRPTNIYGRYDKTNAKYSHVVPAFVMRALERPDPFVMNSLGDGIKNFIHVGDLVRDLAKVMTLDVKFEAFNLCSDETCSISQLVKLIINAVGPDYRPKIEHRGKHDVVSYLNVDRSQFDRCFGKDNYVSLKTGLEETVSWYFLSLPTRKRLTTV